MADCLKNSSNDSIHLPAAEELLSAFKESGGFDSLHQSCMELIQSNAMYIEHMQRLQRICEECISSFPLKPTSTKNDLRNQLRESITKELSKSDFQKNLESIVYNAARQKEGEISAIISESLKSRRQVGGCSRPETAPASSSNVSESIPKENFIESTSASNETALDLLDSFGLSSSVPADIRKKGKMAKSTHPAKHHAPAGNSLSNVVQQSSSSTPDSVTAEQSKAFKTAINEPPSLSATLKLDSVKPEGKDRSSAKKRRPQISSDEEETNDPRPGSEKTDECYTAVNSDSQAVDDRMNSDVEDTDSPMENDENLSDDNNDSEPSSRSNVGRTCNSSRRFKGRTRSLKARDRKGGTHYSPHLLRKRQASSSGPELPAEQTQGKGRKRKTLTGSTF